MAGHSKWAGIKHKKAIIDAKRGKVFTKIAKEITVASRLGGGDSSMNPRLRTAIANGKSVNMPNDNIERAVKKGTGELPGVTYEELTYEGYGVGGVAVMLEIMTDNKNRTVAEIRSIFGKAGGQMGENGCVAWIFEKKGLIVIDKEAIGEDELMELVLDAGADDIETVDDVYEVKTTPDAIEDVKSALEAKEIKIESAQVTMIPQNSVNIDDEGAARKMLKLMDTLEDQDDVQNVYANFDIPDKILETIEQ